MLRRFIVALAVAGSVVPALANDGRARLDELIAAHAKANRLPESLVHRVVKRESRYNPRAVGRGGAMGLMQIKHGTARALGYRGTSVGLLDAETNLTYAVKYLAGAYRTAEGDHDRAVGYYARGYYYAAKRKRIRLEPEVEYAAAVETSPAPPSDPVMRFFARLANPGRTEVAAAAPPAVETAPATPEPAPAAKPDRRKARLASRGSGTEADRPAAAAPRGAATKPMTALAFAEPVTAATTAAPTPGLERAATNGAAAQRRQDIASAADAQAPERAQPAPRAERSAAAAPSRRVASVDKGAAEPASPVEAVEAARRRPGAKVAALAPEEADAEPSPERAPLPPRREKLSVPASLALPQPGAARREAAADTGSGKPQPRPRLVKAGKAAPTREAAARAPALRSTAGPDDDAPAAAR